MMVRREVSIEKHFQVYRKTFLGLVSILNIINFISKYSYQNLDFDLITRLELRTTIDPLHSQFLNLIPNLDPNLDSIWIQMWGVGI